MNSLRSQFLGMAILCEGGLIVIAGVIHWLFPLSPEIAETETLRWKLDVTGVTIGIAGTVPLVLALLIAQRASWPEFQRIEKLLDEILGASLKACRWYDLVGLAVLAGISEEILFRGVLQPRMGLWLSSVVFGLVHPITPTYTLLAAGIGVYLGALYELSGSLWAVAITHGLYDYIAFQLMLHELRRAEPQA